MGEVLQASHLPQEWQRLHILPQRTLQCIGRDQIHSVSNTSMAMSVRASLILLLFFHAEKPICEDASIAYHDVYHRGGFKKHLSHTTISPVLRANPPSHASRWHTRFHLCLCEHLHLLQPPHRHCLVGYGFRPADKKNMRVHDNHSSARSLGSRKWPQMKHRPSVRGAGRMHAVRCHHNAQQATLARCCTTSRLLASMCSSSHAAPNSSRSLLPRTSSSRSGTSSRRACAARGLRACCLLTYIAVRKQAQIG